MKATRNYFETLNWALISWNGWLRNGDKILEEKGSLYLHEQLDIESRKVQELDPHDVEDDILQSLDSIPLRLKQLDDLGIRQLSDEVDKLAGRTANLGDDTINMRLTELQRLIIIKEIELEHAISVCEKFITPENPAGPEEQICPDETTTDTPTNVRELFASTEDCEKFFKDGDSLDCAGWARRAYKYTKNEKLYFHIKGDKKNLHKEIKKRHPKIAGEGTFTHTLNDLNNGTLK